MNHILNQDEDVLNIVRDILKTSRSPATPKVENIEEKSNTYVPNFDHTMSHLLAHTNELHQAHFAPTGSTMNTEFKRHHPEAHARIQNAFAEYRKAVDAACKACHKTRPIKEDLDKIIEDFNNGKTSKVEKKVYHDGFGFGDVMTESNDQIEVMFEHGLEKVTKDTLRSMDQITEAAIEMIQTDTVDQAMALGNKYHERAKKANSQAMRRDMNAMAARYYRRARKLKTADVNENVDATLDQLSTEVKDQIASIAASSKEDQETGLSVIKGLWPDDLRVVTEFYNELDKLGVKILDEKRGRPRLNADAANDDDAGEANDHIVAQLRKSVSLRGEKSVKFKDGSSEKVHPEHARKALDMYAGHKKADDRDKFQSSISASHSSLKKAIGVNE